MIINSGMFFSAMNVLGTNSLYTPPCIAFATNVKGG